MNPVWLKVTAKQALNGPEIKTHFSLSNVKLYTGLFVGDIAFTGKALFFKKRYKNSYCNSIDFKGRGKNKQIKIEECPNLLNNVN